MDVERLRQRVDEGASSYELAREFSCSQTNIRYWVAKEGLSLQREKHLTPTCRVCGCTDRTRFYKTRAGICKSCDNERVLALGQRTRQRILEALGGKCSACGFDKYHCSLDVHHLDSTKKDINFNNIRYWSWSRVLEEIRECTLLCRNCHAAHHHVDFGPIV